MSKIFKPFIALFKLIYRFIDRVIIVPISRLVYAISEFSRENSNKFERILNRPNILIYLSLFCALGLFLLVDSKVINLTDHNAEVIEGQKVNVTYNEEAYVIEGVPETVDITLIGSKSNIYLATQLGNHEVELDLSNYGVGTYKVALKYTHSIDSVEYKLDPSTVTVKISEKVSEKKNLTYDLLNEDKLDSKLSVSNITLSKTSVVVKSSKEILDKVAVVKALVDASLIDLKESGETTLDNVELVAYDSNGNKLDNVEIVPTTVSATITIDSYHATKPVKVVTSGEMASGKAIASTTSSVSEVVVYGEKSVVDKLNYVEASIDVKKLDSDKTMSVNLTMPSGVRYMSETTTNVSVTVGTATQKIITGVSVETINVGDDYVAQASNKDSQYIDVYVTGVESILNSIDASNITATVDCSGLSKGTHTLTVTVSVDNELVTVTPAKTEISVNIY
jgi:YbbR domain-containing protein